MPSAELAAYADSLLRELCQKHPMGYVPTLVWKPFRTTAGMAYYRTGAVGLGDRVLHTPEAVRDTLVHEYAHLLAVHRQGPRAAGHGEPWKGAMRELGAEPRVRHTYAVERNKSRQRVTYRCLACGATFDRSRRLPARRRYVHANCGGDLRLLRVSRVTDEPGLA